MCLIVPKNSKFEITTEDIICYKIAIEYPKEGRMLYITPFRRVLVKFNTIIKAPYFRCHSREGFILHGHHLFINKEDALKVISRWNSLEKVELLKAIIPKGSRVWRGYFSYRIDFNIPSYCSDKIIYFKPLQ